MKHHTLPRQHQNFSPMHHQLFTPNWAPSRTEEDRYRAVQIRVQRRALLLLRLPPGRMVGQLLRGSSPRWWGSGVPALMRAFGTPDMSKRGTHSVSRAQIQAHPRVRRTRTPSPPLLDSSVYLLILPPTCLSPGRSVPPPTPCPRMQQANAGKTPMVK